MKVVSFFLFLLLSMLLAMGPANAVEKAKSPVATSEPMLSPSSASGEAKSTPADTEQAQCVESAGLSKTKRASAAKAMVRCGDDGNCWRCKCCSNLKWPECCAKCKR